MRKEVDLSLVYNNQIIFLMNSTSKKDSLIFDPVKTFRLKFNSFEILLVVQIAQYISLFETGL